MVFLLSKHKINLNGCALPSTPEEEKTIFTIGLLARARRCLSIVFVEFVLLLQLRSVIKYMKKEDRAYSQRVGGWKVRNFGVGRCGCQTWFGL